MSEVNLISQYEIDGGAGTVTIGFTDDKQLYTKMLFVKKTVPLETVSSVLIRKALGIAKMRCDIKSSVNGKEKIFQMLHFDNTDEQAKKFLEELRSKVPPTIWKDTFAENAVDVKDTSATRTYPLQFWFMPGSKGLAGQSRGAQIGVQYGILCLFVIPIPLLIYVLAAGCYRITTNESGMAIKGLRSKFFAWDDIETIDVTQHHITITQYGAKSGDAFLLKCSLKTKSGRKRNFMIRTFEGKQFVNEMVERKKMSAEVAKIFI